jgi:alkaline phosphatase D
MGINIRKVVKRSDPLETRDPGALNFTHGVASGDPYPSSVILWTRCAPMADDVKSNSTVEGDVELYNPVPIYDDTDRFKPISKSPVCLTWKISTDKSLSKVVDGGQVYTSFDVDYTVKVSSSNPAEYE